MPSIQWLALLLAVLFLAVPVASADGGDPPAPGGPEGSCDVFAYTLDPPDYRIDPDCIGSQP